MIKHGEPKISIVKSNKSNSKAVYEISGLEKGISDAYSSSLRMMLLTHIPGLKPIGMEMMGIKNSQDRPSLIEQPIRDVIRNIERIVVKPKEGEDYRESYIISFDGEIEGDLTLDKFTMEGLEPVNSDLVLLTSSEKHHVKLDITIGLSTGFVRSDYKMQIGNTVYAPRDGFIRVDADFNPVTFVNFTTMNNYPIEGKDTVLMEIETNGSITSKASLAIASNLLIKYLEPLAKLNTLTWDSIPVSPIEKNVIDEYDLPIEYLKLTPAEFNELKESGAVALRDLRDNEHKYSQETRESVRRELERLKLIDIEDNN